MRSRNREIEPLIIGAIVGIISATISVYFGLNLTSKTDYTGSGTLTRTGQTQIITTATPSSAEVITTTATPSSLENNVNELVITFDRNILVMYFQVSGSRIDLRDFLFDAGSRVVNLVDDFRDIELINPITSDTCLVFQIESSITQLPAICNGDIDTFVIQIMRSDSFWYDLFLDRLQYLRVYWNNTLIDTCFEISLTCQIDLDILFDQLETEPTSTP